MIIGDFYHFPTSRHRDVLVEGEVGAIILVDIGILVNNHEGKVHVVAGNAHCRNETWKIMVDGFLVDELSPVEGVDVDPPVVLCKDEPLVVVGDGCPFIVDVVDLDCLEEVEVVDGVVVPVDVEVGIFDGDEQPLSIGCDVQSVQVIFCRPF